MHSPGQDRLLRAVRGEEDIADVASALGVTVARPDGGVAMELPADGPSLRPSTADFADGLLASWARGGQQLQTWATYVLMLTDVDFAALEDDPRGAALLEAIWDASAGRDVSDDALNAARDASKT